MNDNDRIQKVSKFTPPPDNGVTPDNNIVGITPQVPTPDPGSELIPIEAVLRDRERLSLRLEVSEEQRHDLEKKLSNTEQENKKLIQEKGQLEGENRLLRAILKGTGKGPNIEE